MSIGDWGDGVMNALGEGDGEGGIWDDGVRRRSLGETDIDTRRGAGDLGESLICNMSQRVTFVAAGSPKGAASSAEREWSITETSPALHLRSLSKSNSA